MKQRKYFEIFARAGKKIVPDKDHPYEVKALLDDMKYARIHGAAVMRVEADEFSFVYGNEKGIEMARENPRIASIAVVPTTANLEVGDKNYIKNLLDRGVCALTVTPGMRCLVNAKDMDEIANALCTCQKPLIIPGMWDNSMFERIDDIAEEYPDLNIIMHGCNWGHGRQVLKMLERRDNIYIDISSFHLNNLMGIMKENYGIHRLLYSSAWPVKSMGAHKAYIEYANITEEEKDMVAAGNACRLLGIDISSLDNYAESECQLDFIAKEADSGKPISVPVIDAHTHMVGGEDKAVNNCVMKYSDCDSMLEKMDKLGIDSIITAPWAGISIDGIKGNEESLYAAKKYPGRFYAYSTCNINYEEDRKACTEYHEKYPDIFLGIKPYIPYQKFDFEDERCKEWFTYANKHHLPALIHAESPGDIETAEKVIPKYPDITFIIAHAGSSYGNARRAVECAKKYKNVVLEITYTTTGRGMVEFLVENVGADRVLYGSDSPMRDPAPQLGWVCYAKISEEDKKKILSGNIKRILAERK